MDGARFVRVWYDGSAGLAGQDALVGAYRADPATARRYRDLMCAQFRGLTVTIDAMPDPPCVRELPPEQLWGLTP